MLALTISITLSSVIAVVVVASLDTRRRSAELDHAADDAVRELARVVEPPLWDLDMDQAMQMGAAFAEDPRVVQLSVLDNTTGIRRQIVHGSVAGGDTVARTLPVMRNGRLLGTVELALSRAPLRREIRDQVFSALRMSLILLIVAFLVVRLLVRRLLDAPLNELATNVAAYATDQPTPPPSEGSYDEFESLHAVLRAMQTRIALQFQELQASNLNLVREVESHQRTEEALRRSRHLELQVMNSVPQAIFWKDPGGVFLGANIVFARAAGVASPEDVVGRTDFDLAADPRLAERFRALDREVLERREASRDVAETVDAGTGDSRWFDTVRVPLADDRGHVFGVLGVTEDITERRRASEALVRRNRELASLNRFLALASTDVSIARLVGGACEEICTSLQIHYGVGGLFDESSTLFTLVARNAPDPDAPPAGTVVDLGQLPFTRDFVANGIPLLVPHIRDDPRFAGFAADLAKRDVGSLAALPLLVERHVIGAIVIGRRGGDAFRDDEIAFAMAIATQAATTIARYRANAGQRLLRAAIEQTPDCVLISDIRGRIVYANEAFTTITGYSRAEALASTPRLLRSEAHPPEFFSRMWDVLRRGETWRGRITNRRRDGTDIVVDAIIAPVRDEDGSLTNYIAVESDITQELLREQRFQHAQRMDAIGQLAGGIAHDFNNILGAITMELELLELEHALPDSVKRVTEDVRASAHRAANLTRQLLMFSRRQVMTMRPHDLNVVVRELMRMVTRLIGEQVTTEFQPAPQPAVFNGDAGMIEQVIVNLCVNARDAMPSGGTLTLRTRLASVRESEIPDTSEATAGRFVVLEISDTGTGMTTETLDRLFEPYFTTKEVGKGTGLGLATASGLVAQHHGWIEVDSELGKGTTFRIFLPAVASDPAEQAPSPALATPETAAMVLLVEDEAPVRRVVARGLRRLGYRVVEAANGVEALEEWGRSSEEIQLLLTDMVMPKELSGLDLAVRLREDKPSLKIVIMSGYDVRLVGVNAGLLTDIDFLGKPFTIATLGEVVTRVLASPT